MDWRYPKEGEVFFWDAKGELAVAEWNFVNDQHYIYRKTMKNDDKTNKADSKSGTAKGSDERYVLLRWGRYATKNDVTGSPEESEKLNNPDVMKFGTVNELIKYHFGSLYSVQKVVSEPSYRVVGEA